MNPMLRSPSDQPERGDKAGSANPSAVASGVGVSRKTVWGAAIAIGSVMVSAGIIRLAANHDNNWSDEGEAVPADEKPSAEPTNKLYPVVISRPNGPQRVDSTRKDIHGEPVMVACSTCHATRTPNPQNRAAADLDQFHKGLQMAHGGLSCLTCHNRDNYDTLRLADGTPVEYRDVMTLCAQCHGPQTRDYEHGSHGGMTGYWDRSRGPRRRNNCIDCHDPHAPAYPKMTPVFPPRDRFLPAGARRHGETTDE